MKILHPLVMIRVLLGVLFFVSGFSKLIVPYQNFLLVINSYEVLNPAMAAWAAQVLPWFELILGAFLILGLWLRLSLLTLLMMNGVFIGVILSALIRKLPINDCGCFGEFFHVPLHVTLILDICIGGFLIVLLFFYEIAKIASLDEYFKSE